MPKEYSRTRRIGEQLKRELAVLVRTEADDPRLLMVSITAVEVTRDLAYATVYITLLGDPEQRAPVLAALNHNAVAFRRILGKQLHVRTIPKLTFVYDEVIERGAALSKLIDSAVQSDREKHQDDDNPDAVENNAENNSGDDRT